MRSWRQYYTVLIGPLLHFYREKRDFQQVKLTILQPCVLCVLEILENLSHACVYTQNAAAAPAINVSHGVCEIAKDYQKKKNALRLKYVAITD